jgi:hypothetical protein
MLLHVVRGCRQSARPRESRRKIGETGLRLTGVSDNTAAQPGREDWETQYGGLRMRSSPHAKEANEHTKLRGKRTPSQCFADSLSFEPIRTNWLGSFPTPRSQIRGHALFADTHTVCGVTRYARGGQRKDVCDGMRNSHPRPPQRKGACDGMRNSHPRPRQRNGQRAGMWKLAPASASKKKTAHAGMLTEKPACARDEKTT